MGARPHWDYRAFVRNKGKLTGKERRDAIRTGRIRGSR